MSLPTYPAYRDSGISFLGQIPGNWDVARLGFDCQTLVPMRDKPEDLSGPIPWIRIEDFDGKYIGASRSQQGVSLQTVESMNLKVFPQGTVLCSCSCSMGATAIVCTPLVSNQTFIGVVPGAAYLSDYLYYFFLCAAAYLNSIGTGAIQTYLSRDDFRQLRLPRPPLQDQAAVAAFLDRETAKIDALIAEQEKLIALLAEKRQATISHAVTRGLDPDVPMKDSGVPWLGSIPAHWEVIGLTKYLDSVVDYRGRTPTKVDDGVFLVTAKNIRNGAIDYEASQEYIDPSEYDAIMRRGKPACGDVLFTTEAPLGQVALVDREDIALAQRVIKFRSAPERLVGSYLKTWIMGSACQFNLQTLATGSTALGIKGSKVGQVRLCLPPMKEQEAIVQFVDAECARVECLASEAQHAIALLRERRSALITAAVTGQIDVRAVATGVTS